MWLSFSRGDWLEQDVDIPESECVVVHEDIGIGSPEDMLGLDNDDRLQ